MADPLSLIPLKRCRSGAAGAESVQHFYDAVECFPNEGDIDVRGDKETEGDYEVGNDVETHGLKMDFFDQKKTGFNQHRPQTTEEEAGLRTREGSVRVPNFGRGGEIEHRLPGPNQVDGIRKFTRVRQELHSCNWGWEEGGDDKEAALVIRDPRSAVIVDSNGEGLYEFPPLVPPTGRLKAG